MWGNLKISMQIHCMVLDSLVCLDHHWLLFVWVGNTELNKWKNVPVYHSWKLFKVEIGVQTFKKRELSKQMSINLGLATFFSSRMSVLEKQVSSKLKSFAWYICSCGIYYYKGILNACHSFTKEPQQRLDAKSGEELLGKWVGLCVALTKKSNLLQRKVVMGGDLKYR